MDQTTATGDAAEAKPAASQTLYESADYTPVAWEKGSDDGDTVQRPPQFVLTRCTLTGGGLLLRATVYATLGMDSPGVYPVAGIALVESLDDSFTPLGTVVEMGRLDWTPHGELPLIGEAEVSKDRVGVREKVVRSLGPVADALLDEALTAYAAIDAAQAAPARAGASEEPAA